MSARSSGARATAILLALLGCHVPQPVALEPDPNTAFDAAAAEAARLIPRPARGGPRLVLNASPLPPFRGVDRATAGYVGEPVCMACHASADAIWATSAHADAWGALQHVAASSRPDCVGCHSTGYLQPTGFRDPSAPGAGLLVQVQCEACHGPGSAHVAAPTAPYGTLPASQAACVACHTWETSPDFDWATAWATIRH